MIEQEFLSRCPLCGAEFLEIVDQECNLTRCACGYVFSNPRPTPAELVRYYSRPAKYDSWLDQLDLRDALWKRRLKLILPFRKKGSLLDVGAGIGQFLSLARPFFETVQGIEVSNTAVEIAQEKYGLRLFHGSIEQFADGTQTFDNISVIHVLEHAPDPVAMIRICHSLLSEGGMLFVAVPNEVASLRNVRRRKLVSLGIRKPHPGAGKFCIQPIRLTADSGEVHLSHFTPRVLERLLRQCGFELVRNTPDPHYLITNKKQKLREDTYFEFCVGIERVLGISLYDTMFVMARKSRMLPNPLRNSPAATSPL